MALAEFLRLQPYGWSHLMMHSFQLGKGGMVPTAGGLSHINGLAGFAPGVLNPAGKHCIPSPPLQVTQTLEKEREYDALLNSRH